MNLFNLVYVDKFHNNWINIDYSSDSKYVKQYDLSKRISLENETVDFLYNSHLLEHFSKNTAVELLKECHRVLKCIVNGYIDAFNQCKNNPNEYNVAKF